MSIVLRVALVAIASTVLTANAMAQKVHYKQNKAQSFTAAEKVWFDRASQQGNGGGGDGGSGGSN
jgi:hypothetical protein